MNIRGRKSTLDPASIPPEIRVQDQPVQSRSWGRVHYFVAREGTIHRRGLVTTVLGWTVCAYIPMRNSVEVGHFGIGLRWRRWPGL